MKTEASPKKVLGKTVRAGRASEHVVVGLLLQVGVDVYLTLADYQGIDAIIRSPEGDRYFDVQIKSAKVWSGQRGLHGERIARKSLIVVLYNSVVREFIWFRGDELARSGFLVEGTWGAIRVPAAIIHANRDVRSAAALADYVNRGKIVALRK